MVFKLQSVYNTSEEMEVGERDYQNIRMIRLYHDFDGSEYYQEDIYKVIAKISAAIYSAIIAITGLKLFVMAQRKDRTFSTQV